MNSIMACCSAIACVAAAWAIPALASDAVPAPIRLRVAATAAECAAAAGSFPCDAALAAYGQVLVFNWMGSGRIDGYRLYANVGGKPVLQETRLDPDQRGFLIPTLGGAASADYCFHVRAFSGEQESWPTNTVCVEPPKLAPPPAPPRNGNARAPNGGKLVTGIETHKNFHPGCPLAQRLVKSRMQAPFSNGVKASYQHRDANTQCGERTLIWSEGSAEFALSDLPARFNKATLKFVAAGARENCVREIFAYNLAIQDNSPGGARYEKLGEPAAWFTYHKTATIAAGLAPQGGHAFDVTAVVRQSIARKYQKQGFSFAVDPGKAGGNNACAAEYTSFSLEFE